MRRLAVLLPLAALAAGLLAWRRRHRPVPALTPAAQPVPMPAPASPAFAASPTTAIGFASVPWELVAAPPDRAELTLRCALPPNTELDRVDAQETPTQVFVTALARREPDAGAEPAVCDATVALSGPLGERELVHAPVDPGADASSGGEPTGPSLYS